LVELVCTRTVEYREAFDTRVVRTDDPVQSGDLYRVGWNPKTLVDEGWRRWQGSGPGSEPVVTGVSR
jgi:hypothetical protein